MNTKTKYAEHLAEAEANNAKPAADLKVGDFILCDEIGLKFDHQNLRREIAEYVEGAKMDAGEIPNTMSDFRDYTHVKNALVKITRIEDKTAGFFDDPVNCLRDWRPQPNEGGSATDDYDPPKGMAFYSLPSEQQKEIIATSYTLAVLVRDPSGKCVVIDAEGFDYPRYLLLRKGWREMWPEVVADTEREIKEAEENKKREEEAERRAREEDHLRLVEQYSYLPCHGADLTKAETAKNLRAALKHEFPGVKFSVRSRWAGYSDVAYVDYVDGPSYDRVHDLVKLFEGAFPHEYGSFGYTIVEREVSPEYRDKIIDLVKKRCPDSNGFTEDGRRREVSKLIARTDFPTNAKIEDVRWENVGEYRCELAIKFAA